MSRFLVDTQLLLWNVYGSKKLPVRVARLFRDGRHQFFYSAASLWEVAIQAELGRITVPDHVPSVVEAAGLSWLPVSPQHAWRSRTIGGLPHRDPFDRMLVTQAASESLTLVTADRLLLGCQPVPPLELVDARA